MRNLMAILEKLTEKFLTYKNLEKDTFNNYTFLLNELLDRNLYKAFRVNLKIANNLLENVNYRNADYYYNRYILEDIKGEYLTSSQDYSTSNFFLISENRESILDNLMYSFLIKYIDFYSSWFSVIQNIGSNQMADDKADLLKFVTGHIENNSYTHIPAILMSYNSIMLDLKDEDIYYFNLKIQIEKYRSLLNSEEKMGLLINLANYAVNKIGRGNKDFKYELLSLYKENLSEFLDDKVNSHHNFNAIVKFALELGELEWAQNFIKEYIEMLPIEHRMDTFYYNKSYIEFSKKNFDEALKYIMKVTYRDLNMYSNCKNLTIKIYYEMNEIEAIISLTDTYKHYLKSHKLLPERMLINHGNFIVFIEKLIKIKLGSKKHEIIHLKKELLCSEVAQKDWLLEKINEFISSE